MISDVAIKRPVFATVIALLLVAFGVLAFQTLPLRELPDIDSPIVNVSTDYRGASAEIVDTRVTQLIEDRISGVEGVKNVTSTSSDGQSNVTIEFVMSRDIDAAANDVRNAIARILDNLPVEADPPQVQKQDSDARPVAWFNLASSEMDTLELTDYARRFIEDRLSVLEGVGQVIVGGARDYAMRIWLDRVALAARGLTVTDVERALRSENIELPAGSIESTDRQFSVRINRAYATPEDFGALTIARGADGYLVRLGDVARVEIAPADRRVVFRGNEESMVGLGVIRSSTANTLEVVNRVEAEIERIKPLLPEGTNIYPSFNSALFIEEAIQEVFRTLLIAMVLVIAVIYVFLGSVRAALVPAVTVPVCLIATFIALAAFGLSINLLTLLALVLAIGLVVDDSIVVLENVQRRVDLGEPPLVAAYRGTRQVGFAVLATTAVLISVFIPIVFLQGNIGRLFSELAIAIACAVAFSSLIALTLSAMMTSKLLRPADGDGFVVRKTSGFFKALTANYTQSLRTVIDRPGIVGLVMVAVLAGIVGLLQLVPSELAPDEDRGGFFVSIRGPEGASFESMQPALTEVEDILMEYVDSGEADRVLIRAPGFGGGESYNSAIAIVNLTHWDERERNGLDIVNEVRGRLAQVPGVRAFAIMRQAFGQRGGGQPVQFVVGGSGYEELVQWRDIVLERARDFPGIVGLDTDYQETKPQLKIDIDTTRAADLGVSVETVGRTLETMMGGRRVTTYVDRGEEYDVIVQGEDEDRATPSDLTNLFVRSDRTGELIPLSNLVTVSEIADAGELRRYNRVRAITFSANLAPGTTLGEALDFLERTVQEELPPTAQIDYKGESAEYRESSGSLLFIFSMALIVVFLVLAAQFESFVHPFVIMLTVPLAVGGALFGLYMTGGTLNIYSQIGIIILVGLAAKNGILIVEFANQMRDAGKSVRDAVLEAAETRFRPVLMTGLSTAFGALPLLLTTGAGSESRATIGIVIFSGVIFATLFTLFVVPVFYRALAGLTKPPGDLARQLDVWEGKSDDEVRGAGKPAPGAAPAE